MSFINDIKEKIHEYNKGRALENKLEENVISNKNNLSYQYDKQNNLLK